MADVYTFIDLCREFSAKHGSDWRDTETGKRYATEEAVCREMYGPRWAETEAFKESDAMPDGTVPDDAISTIIAMTKIVPAWMRAIP